MKTDVKTFNPETIKIRLRQVLSDLAELGLDDEAQASIFGLTKQQLAQYKSDLPKLLDNQDLLVRISCLLSIKESLITFFSDEEQAWSKQGWLMRSNAHSQFKGQRPIDVMLNGSLEAIEGVRNLLLNCSSR